MDRRTIVVFVAMAAWLAAEGTRAQQRGGEVAGTVLGADRRPAAGVTVTLDLGASIVPRSAETTGRGRFWFAEVPPGTYRLRCSRPPGAWDDREVRVDLGSHVELVVRPSAIDASLPRTGEIGAQAERASSGRAAAALGATFTRDRIAGLPTGRDPWALIDLTPGVLAAEVLPGAAPGRIEPRAASRGSEDQALWHVDGSAWTDPASGGALPLYDYEAVEQVRVQTAGHDASIQSAGASVSLVTRAGSNRFRSSGRWLGSGRLLEAENLASDQRARGVSAGDPLVSSNETGGEAGGPIRRGSAWFFVAGSWSRAEHGLLGLVRDYGGDYYDPDNLHHQVTSRDSAQARVDLGTGRRQGVTLAVQLSRRRQNPFDARPTSSPESWRRLHGASPAFRASHEATIGRLLIETRTSLADGGHTHDFQSPGQADVQPAVDMPTQGTSRSTRRSAFTRRTAELKTDGAILLGSGGRGEHALRFGARYRRDEDGERSQVGGQATANFWKSLPNGATLYRNGDQHHRQSTFSAYASDSITFGRATLVAGLRLDRQADRADPSSAPANPLSPEWLPALDFDGASAGVAFTDLAPRVTLTWDLTGSGRSVAKLHAGQYFGSGITVSRRLDPSGLASVTLPWSDDNRDGFVQRGELHSPYNLPPPVPSPPPATTDYRVDPGLANDRVTEALVTFEQELRPGLAFEATGIWRRADRFEAVRRDGISSADFVPVTHSIDRCEAGRCITSTTVTYYDLPFEPPAARVVTNLDAHTTYRGVELGLRGRPRAGVSLDATLTLTDQRLHYHGEGSYQDPTRIPFEDGAEHGAMNSRWQFTSAGLFSLPWGLSSALVVNGRQGYPFVESVLVTYRRYLGSVLVPLAPIGTRRLDAVWTTDWRIEKSVRLRGARLSASLDLFNVTNRATPVRRQNLADDPAAGEPLAVVPPRVARLGLKIEF